MQTRQTGNPAAYCLPVSRPKESKKQMTITNAHIKQNHHRGPNGPSEPVLFMGKRRPKKQDFPIFKSRNRTNQKSIVKIYQNKAAISKSKVTLVIHYSK
jgi:hypothetical protein